MIVLSFEKVRSAALDGVDLKLDAGIQGVLAEPGSGGADLVALSVGWDRPQSGRVRVDGADPFRRPDVRRRIASLLADERIPEAPTVAGAAARVFSARGDDRAMAPLFENMGLFGFLERRSASLSARETRKLALALALIHPRPVLLSLHEPLAVGLHPELVLLTLREHAARGAIVLAVTSSRRDAELLSGRVRVLQRGRFLGELAPPGLPPALPTVVGTSDPRSLSAAIASEPAVSSVVWDEEGRAGQIAVYGSDRSQVALAILRAARSCGATIESITEAGSAARVVRAKGAEGEERGRLRKWAL